MLFKIKLYISPGVLSYFFTNSSEGQITLIKVKHNLMLFKLWLFSNTIYSTVFNTYYKVNLQSTLHMLPVNQ